MQFSLYVLFIDIPQQQNMKISALLVIVLTISTAYAIVDRTYFNYLGLSITAQPQDIERAYQSKKAKIEGLENQQEKTKKMKLLTQAYATLSNEPQRQKYERYGKDVFRTIKEMTCIDKRNPQSPKDLRKSPPFKLTIPVSIVDIYNGTTIKAKFPKHAAQPWCMGTGAASPKDMKPCPTSEKGFTLRDEVNFYGQKYQIEVFDAVCKGFAKIPTKPCPHNNGNRLIQTVETVQIKIPPFGLGNKKLNLRNAGDQPLIGAPSDFEISIVQVPTNNWSREMNNLVYRMNISLKDSLFGFRKEIEHLDGTIVTVEREPQTTTKQTRHIIKQKGLLNEKGVYGSLIVKFKITIPKFTNQQLDMWQDFFNENPI